MLNIIKKNQATISLIISSLLASGGGFLYWVIAARRIKPELIGTIFPIYSTVTLLTAFTILGFGQSVFTNFKNVNDKYIYLFKRLLILVSLTLLVILLYLTSRNYSLTQDIFITLIGFFLICNIITTNAMLSLKKQNYLFIEILSQVLVKLISIIFIKPTASGLLLSLTASVFISSFLSFLTLIFLIKKEVKHNPTNITIKNELVLSLTSYISNLFSIAPVALLPIIALHSQGAVTTALLSILTLFLPLFNMPTSMAMRTLYHEIQESKNIVKNILNTIYFLFPVLIAINLITFYLGNYILEFFGSFYAANGTLTLRLLSLSATIALGNYLFDTVLLAKKLYLPYLLANILGSIALIFTIFLGLTKTNYNIGYLWLFGQFTYSLIAGTLFFLYRKDIFK